MTSGAPNPDHRPSRRRLYALSGIGALALGALLHTWFAIPAAFFSALGWITLPSASRPTFPARRVQQILLGVTSLVAGLSMLRFVSSEAIVGIVAGGSSVVEVSTVTRLREVLSAQDALRRGAYIDPDGDGVGSAALLVELTRWQQLDGRPRLPQQALSYPEQQRVQVKRGSALEVGAYLIWVCLPRVDGTLGAGSDASYDAEAGERRFVAYAWPAAEHGPTKIYAIDEYDRILETPNRQADGSAVYFGAERPPACDLVTESSTAWMPWRGKQPRDTLPGL